ncbi:MAG: type II 3-dehydroquinate dehydratase [Muribaculum sp.]|nr:type II 3-dehydroquinate dehydratase [Muribaculum sp.]
MNITIINGPNLNLLGIREPGIYGNDSFETVLKRLRQLYPNDNIEYFQSNHEGSIIDRLQSDGFGDHDGIILNAGAYTHTSLAIADCIAAINTPVIEVHISNVHAREEFRHHSMLSRVCKGVIIGFGTDGYRLAIESLRNIASGEE